MKHLTLLGLLTMVMFAISGTTSAQMGGMMQPNDQQQEMSQSHMIEQASGTLPFMLEQMADRLAQGNLTPDMLKQMAAQLKQMSRMMQQMPMMNMMPMMSMMHGGMMGPMSMMGGQIPMMAMMRQMMHADDEVEPHQSMGLKLQMQGEMMKAMGEILMKYGKLFAEQSNLVPAEENSLTE